MFGILKMKKSYFLVMFIFFSGKFIIANSDNNTYSNIYKQFLSENNISIYFIEGRFVFGEKINKNDIIRFLDLLFLSSEIIANNIANATTTRTNSGGSFIKNRVVIINGEIDIVRDYNLPVRLVFDPTHPDAIQYGDRRGYVEMPNVDIVSELVDLIIVSRIYENIIRELFLKNISIPERFIRGIDSRIEKKLNELMNNMQEWN